MGEFRAVLLDLDGTLVDSNAAHTRAWHQACLESGYDVEIEAIRPLIGMGGGKLVRKLLGLALDSPASRSLRARREAVFFGQHLPTVVPFPRTRELLERMLEKRYRLVLASASERRTVDGLLQRARIADLLDAVVAGDEVDESKPGPGVILAGLRRAGVPPEDAVFVGDTPYDLLACEQAGVPMIGLRCGGWNGEDMSGCVALMDDPADLLVRWDDSPLAGGGGALHRNKVRDPRALHPVVDTADSKLGHPSQS